MRIAPGDLDDPRVRAMIAAHQTRAIAETGRGSAHALDVDGLRAPDIQLWTIWEGDTLAGVGALRSLKPELGELKSMYSSPEFRGQGYARAMLAHLVERARAAGHGRVSLETGSWDYFIPARGLYAAAGFEVCGPFGDYRPDPNSVFMTRAIAPSV
ncbi:putative acetyltransferase [Sphingomonas vulcanisoli]|uniref:Acetyltransferase n=1 Tax=Sphingomonas vulcanisoli TaxID=1658060 RepID=A0ABX0TNP2_9SPHN|nr:GNAT family N-acetyltransferase [Sphingomonas vulcanisoli]NIJ07141.1 putative acetyltransferase [Sphingomonas vulcanisoli]